MGKTGALALYEPRFSRLEIHPVPILKSGPKGRKELDEDALDSILGEWRDFITHAFVERVNAMPSQGGNGKRRGMGATSAFSFGRTYGQITMALACHRIPRTRITPQTWKHALRVPTDDGGIMARAAELLPQFTHLWRGPKGGFLDGNCEAALIAKHGANELGLLPGA